MPVPRDHTIATRVRSILESHWIDPRALDFGSVNGVVYVQGELRRHTSYPPSRAAREDGALLHVLRRQLGAIDGVKDVSIEVDDVSIEVDDLANEEEQQWESSKDEAE